MFLKGIFVAALAVLHIAVCLPVQEEEKIETVDLHHFCTSVVDDGHEGKSPVLLIHGLSSSHNNWDGIYQVLALQTKRRICAIDLRNHGDSPWNDRIDIAALAKDVEHFLDTQGIDKVNLIGHSLGGKTSIHFTLNNPDRVDSIVVEDMTPNTIDQEATDQVRAFMHLAKESLKHIREGANEEEAKKDILAYINKKLKEIGETEVLNDEDGKSLELRLVDSKWQWKMNIDVLDKGLEDVESIFTISSGLYTGPALFIYGTESSFKVDKDEENIHKLFPNAKLVPVKGAGHIIHGRFREFDDEVIRFLNGVN